MVKPTFHVECDVDTFREKGPMTSRAESTSEGFYFTTQRLLNALKVAEQQATL